MAEEKSGFEKAIDSHIAESVDAAPRPWNWVSVAAKASGGCHVYLTDANGRKIGVIWGKGAEKIATIQKICDEINASDRRVTIQLPEGNIEEISPDQPSITIIGRVVCSHATPEILVCGSCVEANRALIEGPGIGKPRGILK